LERASSIWMKQTPMTMSHREKEDTQLSFQQTIPKSSFETMLLLFFLPTFLSLSPMIQNMINLLTKKIIFRSQSRQTMAVKENLQKPSNQWPRVSALLARNYFSRMMWWPLLADTIFAANVFNSGSCCHSRMKARFLRHAVNQFLSSVLFVS
jgi:flagellar biosynthesis protein FliP